MQLMTFDTILNFICDEFDKLISPRRIARTNNNIIYLMFKAVSKGFEVINNVCVTLSHKFDPAYCSDEDLESVARLVGTERLEGSASGLFITVYNPTSDTLPFLAGNYYYKLNDDVTFMFEVPSYVELEPNGGSATFVAFSEDIGSFPVTAQEDITITPEEGLEMVSSFTFSCQDNANLLGTDKESNLEFRERINKDTTRQDALVELETTIKNQPYIFDAKVVFNNLTESVTYDGIDIPSYYMAVFYSGAARNELASLIAKKSIFPTVATEDSTELHYNNEVFADGSYKVNVIPFKKKEFKVKVVYTADITYVSYTAIQNRIKEYLFNRFRRNMHSDFITEAEVFNALFDMNLANIKFLNVDLYNENSEEAASYISVPKSRLPYITDVTFERLIDA